MKLRTRSSWAATGVCVVALGAFATLALCIPADGSGPFSLPLNGTKDIYDPPAAKKAGVTVKCTSGTVKVRSSDGTQHTLGQVPAGRACVFEGEFDLVSLLADMGAAGGEYSAVAPIDDPAPLRLIGSGTLNLGAGATYSPYGGFTAAGALLAYPRAFTVDLTANSDPVTITGSTGTAYVVDGGDWGFCSRSTTKFTTTGKGAVPFAVYDPAPNCTAISGAARAQTAGDSDSLSLDGQENLEIKLTNSGAGSVTVTYTLAGGQPTNVVVPASESTQLPPGLFQQFEWTYEYSGCAVNITVTGK